MDDIVPKKISTQDPINIGSGKLVQAEVVIFEDEYVLFDVPKLTQFQVDISGDQSIKFLAHIGADDFDSFGVFDVHDVGVRPFEQQGIFCACIEDEF